MAKPILIVKAPITFKEEELDNIEDLLQGKFDDYHILLTTNQINSFDFQVFYEKDFNHVKLEELKKLIKQNG